MITTWQEFLEVFSLGVGAGFMAGLSALLVRYVRFSYVRFFRTAANL